MLLSLPSQGPHHSKQQRALTGLLLLLTLLFSLVAQPVLAASSQCDFATGKGTTGPVDFARYCWIDFGNYNDTQARSAAGQDFAVSLPAGTLSFNLKVTGGALVPASAPNWSGSAFGQSAFTGIPGTPSLYQNTPGTTVTVTLSNIIVSTSSGDQPYTFVAADAESSNNGESLSFKQVGGNSWYQLAQMPNGTSTTYPTLTGLGTDTVTETGVAGTVGAYAFANDFPANFTIGSVTATLVGGGLQGAAFGIKYHSADLAMTSTHAPATFVPGGSGSYTLRVHNNGPEKNVWAPGDTTTVTTTLPTGLTYVPTGSGGSGWSCSASGQIVTCTSTATINSGADMANITLNVSVANNPASLPASVTTSSSVANVYDYDSSNNTANDATPILHPSLITSTKGVVDVNGGNLVPGDTLKYTVILTESNGIAATGVSLIDDMPADVQNLLITGTPSGSTDSSSTTGGANGTGQVNIGNISVPANGSVSVTYTVDVAASATTGEIITNTANLDNTTDPNATDASPSTSITVQQNIPASGNKVLYVYTSNDALSRTPQTGTGGDIRLDRGDSHDFTLTPSLAKLLTLNANSNINVTLLVQCTRNTGGSNCRNSDRSAWDAQLLDYDGSTYTQIGTTSANQSFRHDNYTAETVSIPVSATTTVASGHQLVLRITNNATNNNNRYLHIEQYDNGDRSHLTLDTSTVINVDSVTAYSAAYPATTQVTSYVPGNTVYVRALVSDPFGSFDIDPTSNGVAPTITIKDTNGTTQVAATNMAEVNDSGAATKTFEYAYTLPSAPVLGAWTASIIATEGQASIDYTYNGGATITHSANGSFAVQAPNLMLMKSVAVLSDPSGSSMPHALPGAVLQYSLNVSNQGLGAVDANSLKLADTLDSNTAFIVGSASFTDGSPASGLTFSASDVEYCTGAGGATCPYTSGVSAGSPDPAITKVIFTPQGVLNGKASSTAPAPSFTINYKVQLK